MGALLLACKRALEISCSAACCCSWERKASIVASCLCRRRGVTSLAWPKPKFKIDAGKQGRVRSGGLARANAISLYNQLVKGSSHVTLCLQVIKIASSLGKVNELNFNSGEWCWKGGCWVAQDSCSQLNVPLCLCQRRMERTGRELLHAGAPHLGDVQVRARDGAPDIVEKAFDARVMCSRCLLAG